MAKALRKKVTDFDVVHIHTVFLWPTFAASRAAQRSGVPYVLAPRGMLVNELIRRKSRVAKQLWIRAFEGNHLANAAAVHATSELELEEIQKLELPISRTFVLSNGIESPSFESSEPSGESGYVLSLGRINWKKGIDRLISAVANLPDVRLVIAGNDEDGLQATLEQQVERLGIAGRVCFVGPVHGGAKWNLLRNAAIFALPSHSESFGIAVLEAMSCGVPVIVTPEVGLAKFIGKVGAGIVSDGNPCALKDAIQRLLGDPRLRRELGQAGRVAAHEQFGWETIAKKMDEIYSDILNLPATAHA
jgi:glycosyltransferase involved in cell wall biosynthesis